MAVKIRQSVTAWIQGALPKSPMELVLASAGFLRREGSLVYERQRPEIVQQINVVFDVGPRYDPTAIAHVLPQVVIESSVLGDLVRQMAPDSPAFAGRAVDLVLRHQLQNLAPKGEARQRAAQWLIRSENDTAGLLARMGDFLRVYALPFLDQYRDIISLVRGYDGGDDRLRTDRRVYLYIVAAFVHTNQLNKALQVLEEVFGLPATRKEYGRAFDFLRARCAS